jgi:Holliday junction resolvasome RuvABC endonuclease subunit
MSGPIVVRVDLVSAIAEILEDASPQFVLDEEVHRAKARDAALSVDDRAAAARRADVNRNLAETCLATAQHFRSMIGGAG